MNGFKISGLSGLLTVLASCAATPGPVQPTPPPAEPPEVSEPGERAQAVPTPPDVLYQVLAGEVAGRHRDYAIAARHYLKAAQHSRDPAIAQRAVQIALFAGESAIAGAAVDRLLHLVPGSAGAHRTAASLALQQGDLAKLEQHLENVIALSAGKPLEAWQQTVALLSRAENHDQALAVMAHLAGTRPESQYAQYAYSLLASHFDRYERALNHAGRALALAPEWGMGYNWRGRLHLSEGEYEAAAKDLKRAVELDPDALHYRYHYAEALRQLGRYGEAQAVLAELPIDGELLRTRAALALEAEDWSLAGNLYRKLLELGGYDHEARFFLGQVAELQKHPEEALDWYGRVGAGTYQVEARIRQAAVLHELNRLDEALALLDGLIAQGGAAAVDAWLAKGRILADSGRIEDAFAMYDKALAQRPGNTKLLYGQALLAAEQGRVSLAEQGFRAILEQKPKDAMTLNALGYTLADETQRYREALDLIRQALQLEPNDPAIIDSMGWVQYRLGHMQAAEKHLRRALELQFDAEVAAHLGEVLWVRGEREAARNVWQKALEKQPERSAIVHETMQRLMP